MLLVTAPLSFQSIPCPLSPITLIHQLITHCVFKSPSSPLYLSFRLFCFFLVFLSLPVPSSNHVFPAFGS